ncbi:shikimate kinase [Dokdonella sp.]|uniref:shikimate kinase n=1 Tax=Dokdonella sp. TaxID=2291710 RepID=UPI0031C83646|nr:shikimate kinase [Dokdonella sp.]
MNPAPNLFLVGPMGAGKTTVGRHVAELYRLPFFDLDQEIEARTGAPVSLIFDLEGEAGFRRRESALLDEHSARRGCVLATGGGAVLAADNRRRLHERGFVVWLDTPVEAQLARLSRDRQRPLLQAPDRRLRLERMAAERNPLYAEVADLRVPSGGPGSSLHAAHDLLDLLEARWQRGPIEASA